MSRTYLRILFLVALITILQTISTTDATADVNCTQKPELINPRHCCAVPNLVTAEIRRKCLQKRHEHWRAISTHRRPQRYRNRRHFKRAHLKQMYWSCVLNETGIIANGTLQQANLTEYLHKITDDAHIIPIVVQSFEFCMNFNYSNVNATHHRHHHHPHHHPHPHPHNHTHEHAQPHEHERLPRSSCTSRRHGQRQRDRYSRRYSNRNRYGSMRHYNFGHTSSANETNARRLMICVYQETFINCPHKSWNNTDVCNAKRDFIQHCRVHNATLPVLTPETSTDAPPPLPMPMPQPTSSNADDDEDQDDQLGFMGEENVDAEMTDDDDVDDDNDDDDDDDYTNYNSYTNNETGLNGVSSEVNSLNRGNRPNSSPKSSPNVAQPQSEYQPDIDVRVNA